MSSDDLFTLVYERARGCCEYCLTQRKFSPDPFSLEHILPKSRDGLTDEQNIALSCQGCNGHKFTAVEALDPLTLRNAPLYHPRRDRWSDHFRWSDDYLRIVGTSPMGRATIERVRLNREEVVNLREVLVQVGKHPPDYDFTGESRGQSA